MLEKIKLALRISHNYLDNDIISTIKTARSEMMRAGVPIELAENEDNELVDMAIKTYCQYIYTSDDKAVDRYLASWQYQVDCLRKSTIEVD